MVVDVVDVLRLQLVAVVIDLVLDVERAVDVERLLAAAHQGIHLRQRLLGEFHHLVQVVVLALDEVVLLAVVLTRDGTCHVVAGIANRLQLRNLTEHGADLRLGVVTEVGITHGVEVLGNLQLHVVGDALVLLYSCEQLVEVASLVVLLVRRTARQGQQLTHHTEHALHAVGKLLYLLLGLQHGKLGGLHESGSNEVQAEVLLLVDLLGLDDPADELLYLGDEPNQDKGIGHVERRVECCQNEAQLGGVGQEGGCSDGLLGHVHVIAYPAAHHVDERTEDEQDPDDTKHVEEHVSQSSTTSLRVCRHRSEV